MHSASFMTKIMGNQIELSERIISGTEKVISKMIF